MSKKGLRGLSAAVVVAGAILAGPPEGWPQDGGRTPGGDRLRVRIDPRVELIGIVCRLAGYPEYSMGRVQSYTNAVDAHFAGFKDHAVVARARQLRRTRGISFNAPISLAVHVTDPPALAERIPLDPLPAGIDPRWTPGEARAFLADLRSFVREARAMEFLAQHVALYQAATERLTSLTRGAHVVEWLDEMFGRDDGREFVVVGGLLNGGGNYGALAHGVAGDGLAAARNRDQLFAVLGTEVIGEDGLPSYPARLAGTIVHEFSHSFLNPLVDAHEGELQAAIDGLFPLVETRMRGLGYGLPKVMLYESLVRACTVRYLSSHAGAEAVRRQVQSDRDEGFPWVGPLADALQEYERDRSRYRTIDAFVPRVGAFFDGYVRVAASDLRRVEAEQRSRSAAIASKGPRVVSMSPPDEAMDVDASSVTAISITFDRPMREGNFAVFPVAQAALPTLKGPPRFDADGRTITLACELKPGVTYGLQFNSTQHLAFVDLEGNPLAPFVYRFTTRR